MDLARDRSKIEEKFLKLCTEVAAENDLKVYDLDYFAAQSALRLFIMKAESNTADLEDCIKVDRALTPHIDNESWMPEELNLEVSSPGMFRDLRQKWHFEISLNDQVLLSLRKNLGEEYQDRLSKKTWKGKKVVGILKSVSDEGVELEVENVLINFEYTNIKKANLEPNI